jgi:hypothetical protein
MLEADPKPVTVTGDEISRNGPHENESCPTQAKTGLEWATFPFQTFMAVHVFLKTGLQCSE